MKHYILGILIFVILTNAEAQEIELPKLDLTGVKYPLPDSVPKFRYVQPAKVLFRASDGFPAGTNETYLLFYEDDGYLSIRDSFIGHSVRFEMHNLDREGPEELFAFYSAGGSQRLLRVYKFEDDKIQLIDSSVSSSNMDSIYFKDGLIVVENQRRVSERKALLIVEQFIFDEDKIVFKAKSQKEIVE